jgi:excisionase family DNA binding protein
MSEFLTAEQMCQLLHISRSTLTLWVASGRTPRPLRPSMRHSLFDKADVQSWIAAGMPPRQDWERRKQAAPT